MVHMLACTSGAGWQKRPATAGAHLKKIADDDLGPDSKSPWPHGDTAPCPGPLSPFCPAPLAPR